MKKYIENGILKIKESELTAKTVRKIVAGLVRYAGNAKTSESGAELPLQVLLGGDRESEGVISLFEEALESAGCEHGNAGELPTAGLNFAFFDMGFDLAVAVFEDVNEKNLDDPTFNIEFFERGDQLGGLEAILPGGVNHKGTGSDEKGTDLSEKIKKFPYGLPVSQAGVNQIELAFQSDEDFPTATVELHEDLHEDAEDRYESHLLNYLNKIGPASESGDLRQEIDLTGLKISIISEDPAKSVAEKVFTALGATLADDNFDLKIDLTPDGSDVKISSKKSEINRLDVLDFIYSYLNITPDTNLLRVVDDKIILPTEPLPDGILLSLLIAKILTRDNQNSLIAL